MPADQSPTNTPKERFPHGLPTPRLTSSTSETVMQIQANHADEVVNQARANVLRITAQQLGAWAADAERRMVMTATDEDAWEGTEIDVRRTVL